MTRKEELTKYICKTDEDKIAMVPIIEQMVFLENQLDKLREMPFLQVHPNDQSRQRATPAAKQYKELLQQYTNILKIVTKQTGTDMADEESPLRKWVKSRVN
jgi:hypothetical protein